MKDKSLYSKKRISSMLIDTEKDISEKIKCLLEKKDSLHMEIRRIDDQIHALETVQNMYAEEESTERSNEHDKPEYKTEQVVEKPQLDTLIDKCKRIVNSDSKIWRPCDVEHALEVEGHIFQCKKPAASIAPALMRLANKKEIILIDKDGKKNKYQRKKSLNESESVFNV